MKLWLIDSADGAIGYDCNDGHVIRAETEAEARAIAAALSMDEGSALWLDPARSDCVEITQDGEPGAILTSFNAG